MSWTASLAEAATAAPWLNEKRARGWALVYGMVVSIAVTIFLLDSRDGIDAFGRPLGTDFASFWTAARLAFNVTPSEAWSVEAHSAAQRELFGPDAGYAAFFYPPPFLLICLPLALAPYTLSLGLWLASTGAAWMHMARSWVRGCGVNRVGGVTLLAFPAVLINVGHGQNAFLTASLFGFGALLLDRRPWLAGMFFGCLVIKPHLAILVPILLVMTRNWRAFSGATIASGALCGLSLLILGPDSWRAFAAASALARATLECDLVGYAKMQSAFSASRLLGASLATAWFVQAVSACVAVVCLWRIRRADWDSLGAALVCATLLTTPFLFDYDLTILVVPLLWLLAQGQRTGFRSFDRVTLLIGTILPLVGRPLAMATHVSIAPFVYLALLACIIRRVKDPLGCTRVPEVAR